MSYGHEAKKVLGVLPSYLWIPGNQGWLNLVDSRIKTARISYIAHAGRNLPVEEFSYLRTAYYTAAVWIYEYPGSVLRSDQSVWSSWQRLAWSGKQTLKHESLPVNPKFLLWILHNSSTYRCTLNKFSNLYCRQTAGAPPNEELFFKILIYDKQFNVQLQYIRT